MHRLPLAVLLLLSASLVMGCAPPGEPPGDDGDSLQPGDDDDQTPGDDDDSVFDVTLSGVVTRSIEPALDGIGTLRVRVLATPPPNAEVAATFVLTAADLSAADSEIPYQVTGIPSRDEPYQVSAVLDDDGDGGRPDESDMRVSPRAEVTLGGDVGSYTLDLVLNAYGTAQGDDDDSAGDDDDSAGDDDDSAGDDDDSARRR